MKTLRFRLRARETPLPPRRPPKAPRSVWKSGVGRGLAPLLFHLSINDHGIVTIVMKKTISKSKMKAKALEYFREVERTGNELIITDHGRPVLKLVPYHRDRDSPVSFLRETVVRYDAPTEPVGEQDWEALE